VHRVHGGPRAAWTLDAAVPHRRVRARAHRSSPAVDEGDEGDKAVPKACSLEDERWRRGSAMMVARSHHKCGGGRERAREQGERCGVL
jgi:hypothetical protein